MLLGASLILFSITRTRWVFLEKHTSSFVLSMTSSICIDIYVQIDFHTALLPHAIHGAGHGIPSRSRTQASVAVGQERLHWRGQILSGINVIVPKLMIAGLTISCARITISEIPRISTISISSLRLISFNHRLRIERRCSRFRIAVCGFDFCRLANAKHGTNLLRTSSAWVQSSRWLASQVSRYSN